MLPLTLAKEGETVTIAKITGKDDARQHLAELGFTVNTKVTVVSRNGEDMIIQVRDARVALGREMARRIMY